MTTEERKAESKQESYAWRKRMERYHWALLNEPHTHPIHPAKEDMIENLRDSGWGDEEIRRELEIGR